MVTWICCCEHSGGKFISRPQSSHTKYPPLSPSQLIWYGPSTGMTWANIEFLSVASKSFLVFCKYVYKTKDS